VIVTIEDEAGGPFILINTVSTDSCKGEVRLDLEELEEVVEVAKMLINQETLKEAQASSREVAEPAPVAGGLVARVAYAITGDSDGPITGCKLFTKTAGGSMVKYSALAIGKWFVAYAETEEDADTSNLRVQKLLYYAQGHYLARKGVPLFDEAIQAWSHGPVVPEVYHVFKRFGSNPVKLDKSDDFNFSDIDEETTQFLLEVWSAYAPYSTWALRNMTHKEQPWKNTFNGSLNVPISIEEIGKYFASV